MMSRVLFTSDQHFDHNNIIKYCERPFSDISEMNTEITLRYNAEVMERDNVFFVGDFALNRNNKERTDFMLSELSGFKHLIRGNHDAKATVVSKMFTSVSHGIVLEKVRLEEFVSKCGIKFSEFDYDMLVIVHNPRHCDKIEDRKVLVIHGHCHGNSGKTSKDKNMTYVDVGVDCWDFRPVCLGDILEVAR